jgi:hypothetical protein
MSMMDCCKEDMMGMMSKMMEGDHFEMMMEMMPKCLGMMLPNVPKEKRVEFALKMVAALMEQSQVGMSEEEKEDFVEKVIEKVKG